MGKSRFLKYPFERKAAQKNALFGAYPGVMAQGGFTPRALQNLFAWYDVSDEAARLVTTGDIETLYDKSGNGRHATQSNAAYRPEYVTNWNTNKSAAYFDASGQNLNCSGFSHSGARTIFIVSQYAGGTERTILSTNTGGGLGRIEHSVGGNDLYLTGGSVYALYALTSVSQMTVLDNGASTVVRQYGKSTDRSGPANTTNALNAIIIGALDTSNTQTFNGYVCEIIVYNRALTNAEIFAVEGYLADKWSLIAAPDSFTRLFDFDASKGITLNGALVSDWADQSGNARHVSQANPTYQPTYNAASYFGGVPSVIWGGASAPSFMESATFGPIATPYSIFAVHDWDDGIIERANILLNVGNAGVNDSWIYHWDVGENYVFVRSGADGYWYRHYVNTAKAPRSAVHNIADPMTMYWNGRQAGAVGVPYAGTQPIRRIQMGAQSSGLVSPYMGKLARICAMSGVRTADECAKLAFHANRTFTL